MHNNWGAGLILGHKVKNCIVQEIAEFIRLSDAGYNPGFQVEYNLLG